MDVKDREKVELVFKKYKPGVVFHAAAHKHVPLMEANIEDAITNNILGTKNVVEAAIASKVERLVMISTDKAIRPISVMGATKRMAEMVVLEAAQRSGCAFSVVRFGNVLGSSGSVIPKFIEQIKNGGPVTVTHPDITRYFMLINEAVQLVLQAASIGEGGEVFILDMGSPIKITEMAENLIYLMGREPHKDIEIRYTGLREGEKINESLYFNNNISAAKHIAFKRTSRTFISQSNTFQCINTRDLIYRQGNIRAHDFFVNRQNRRDITDIGKFDPINHEQVVCLQRLGIIPQDYGASEKKAGRKIY